MFPVLLCCGRGSQHGLKEALAQVGVAKVALDAIKLSPEFLELQLVPGELGFPALCLPVAGNQRENRQREGSEQGPARCYKEFQSNRKRRTEVDKSVNPVGYSAKEAVQRSQEAPNDREFS